MSQHLLESKLVTFNFSTTTLENIRCDISIDDITTWSGIKIKTKDSAALALIDQKDINIRIQTHGEKSEINDYIFIHDAFIDSFEKFMNHPNSYYEFKVIPKNIYTHTESYTKETETPRTIRFFINDAPLIAPFSHFQSTEDGVISHSKGEVFSVCIDAKNIATMDIKFTSHITNKSINLEKYQIIEIQTLESEYDVEKINSELFNKIDSLCDIISLAHGEKVICTSWLYQSPEKRIFFHRKNYKEQPNISTESNKRIIEKRMIKDFLQRTYDNYISSPYYDSLRLAINSLTIDRIFVEQQYLSLFQAYESLVLNFKKQQCLENIIKAEDFSKLRKKIEKQINKDDIPDKEARSRMKAKLAELNRPSLEDITKLLLEETEISNKDLWPLFKDGKGISLSELRNIIIHGEILPPHCIIDLHIASEHLKIHLSRLVCTLLKWEINNTNISEERLQKRFNLTDKSFCNTHRNSLSTACDKNLNPR
ncbi:hypothetical protein [Citrobacter sp. Cpo015]|uniref:hypothetical protein n=1 Tax=Citrobacter sp. Cpo015 TaxID=2985121 RepID=UPI0025776CA9|nr:hypothetical protein [Citrobacter sp. Cpo015]MDM2907505.1 hypothetical protein [Citrobacter sp. Cpo015]